MMRICFAILVSIATTTNASAVSYECPATKKFELSKDWSAGELNKWKFLTKLVEDKGKATVSRCSFSSSANSITCDDYDVDRIDHSPGPGIKKYYVFKSQYSFQLFGDLTSIEDNGRGSFQFGKCIVVSP